MNETAALAELSPSHISPLAGKPVPVLIRLDTARLERAYAAERPDPKEPSQRVAFGTSGHRGSAFDRSFNEWHVLAITQAICDYRGARGIHGPLFMGVDTHALSGPACATALEVLAANGVLVMLALHDEFTPTPAISHAILTHNRRPGEKALADGIVITPSHNPPRDGGFKYNPTHGGPAGEEITQPIQAAANRYLERKLEGVRRVPHELALAARTTHRHDFLHSYVEDLGQVVDMDAIREAGVRIGVDPLGGAGVHYWPVIAQRWGLDLTVVSDVVDPAFAFMTLDWDGKVRMDPSSPYAMQRLLGLAGSFDVALACDTDHDRHGIVTPGFGLLPANHYQCVAIDHLFRHRRQWPEGAAVGKTVVGSQLIDRLANSSGRRIFETPVGFKWFSQGLLDQSLGWASEESAGASFLRRDGSVWTTDKDGIAAALLAAEITAVQGRNPGQLYLELADQFGAPHTQRVDAPTTPEQKARLAALKATQISATELAGDRVTSVIDKAPGNGAPIGGIRVSTAQGWFAARPSGTESIYKLYAESFVSEEHLQRILQEAQAMVDEAVSG
ncbi:phosphoglucomutase (alpha-D-glucose-1,6-bisphosphate-dependent) [Burkholderiaceae bacterium UC74_6]